MVFGALSGGLFGGFAVLVCCSSAWRVAAGGFGGF